VSINIAITGRDEAELAAAGEEIRALGVQALSLKADMEVAADVENAVAQTFEVFGHIDILFNNAGHSHATTPIEATDEEWASQLNIHLMACSI